MYLQQSYRYMPYLRYIITTKDDKDPFVLTLMVLGFDHISLYMAKATLKDLIADFKAQETPSTTLALRFRSEPF